MLTFPHISFHNDIKDFSDPEVLTYVARFHVMGHMSLNMKW